MIGSSWIAVVVALSVAASSPLGMGGAWLGQHIGPTVQLLLFGFLGLAVQGGPGGPIENLTETIRNLAAGEYDVDIATDRDDEIGQLYETVEEPAATLRDREQERQQSEHYRQELYQIAADTEVSGEEKIQRLLELGRDRLDVEAGFVSHIDAESGQYDVQMAAGSDLVEIASETDLSEMYCERTIESDGPLGIYNASEEGWAEHPSASELGVSCYLGGKLLVEGDLYGTLCFVSEEPHEKPFSPEEKTFVDLMARWVSHVLEQREHERRREENERYRRELYEITSKTNVSDEEKIKELLQLGRDYFDIENGIVTRIDEETRQYEVQTAVGTDFVEAGTVTDLTETFCRKTIRADDILGIYNATAEGYASDAAAEVWGINCYIGGKLLVDNKLYGTLCFVSPESQDEPFSQEERTFVDLMTRWVSHVLERREHERELRQKERAMEAAPIGITITDASREDNPIVYANDGFERTTGYSPAEVVGRNCRFLQGEETQAEAVARLRAAVEAEESTTVELRNYRKEGTPFWNRVSIAPVTDDTDNVTHFVGFQEDVTERKAAQQQLQKEKERFESLIKEVDEYAIFRLDSEGYVRSWNTGAERIKGYEADEILGDHFSAFYVQEDRDEGVPQQNLEIAREQGSVEKEGWRVRADGSRFWAKVTITTLTDENGRVDGFAKITRDMTERREYEQQLEAERNRFAALFENASNEVAHVNLTDEDSILVRSANQQFTETFGYEQDEIGGQPLADYIVPAEQREQIDELAERARRGERLRNEVSRETITGERREFIAEFVPIGDQDRPDEGYAVYTDITERNERERELRETKRRLELALEGTKTGVWEWNVDTNDVVWDETLEQLLGLEPRSFEGTMEAFRQRVHPDDLSRVEDAVYRAVENDDIYQAEFRMLHEDGSWRWLASRGRVVNDPTGTRMVGIHNDITERKEREKELHRYKEHTDDLLDAIDDVFYVLDADGNLQRWNESLANATGYSDDEIADMHALDFFHEDDQSHIASSIEEVFEEGDARIESAFLTKDGDRIPYEFVAVALEDLDGDPVVTGIGRDISERKAYERELERTKYLLDQAQRLANVGGWELDVTSDPPAMTWTSELYRLHGLPPDADLNLDRILEQYHPDDRPYIRDQFETAIETGDGYDMQVRLGSGDGDITWVRALCEPVYEENEVAKLRGSIQDITEQKEREQALRSLHETTRELLGAETADEVADLVAETAANILDVSGVGIYLLGDESNRLEPIAFTPGFVEHYGGAPSAADRDSVAWDVFVAGTGTVFDDSDLFDGVDGGLAVPIGDYGTLVVTAPPSRIDTKFRQLTETLVATTMAAFDRLESEASLRERDAELELRNERLRHQIKINDLIRRIDQSLIGANSREEIEASVCERLVENDDVTFAWIGTTDASRTKLEPQTWAGPGEGYLDGVGFDDLESGTEPAIVTAREKTPAVVPNIVEGIKDHAWRRQALANDFHSAISVPIALDEYYYGVLTVYANEPHAFGDLERTVFAEFGENIANSITAVKTRNALHSDAAVELTLQFDESDTFLAQVARKTGSRIEYDGLATDADEETRLFFTTDEDSAAVEAVLEDLVSVTDYRLVTESNGRARFEAAVTKSIVASHLVRHGGTPRSIEATDAGLEVVVDVPPATDIREFVEMLRTQYPSIEMTGRRDVQRENDLGPQQVTSLLTSLTDRQQEVLRTAYFAGFFEWPRENTGEDVAEMLDISQPTVNRHLRRSQQRLFERLFDESGAVTVS